jgi:hypothetical protein
VFEIRKLLLFCAALFLAQGAFIQSSAQTAQTQPARQRLIGEVTAVDASANALTVKSDAGESVNVTADEKTTVRRLPPGETSLDKATSATFADVRVGDRVLAVGVGTSGGVARQLILTTRAAAAGAGRDDGRRLIGRVVSVDASKKLIVVQTRGREAAETVNVDASNAARVLHYAPDSSRVADAQPATFADIRVGDQLRATGERAADGATFRAEEVIAGSFTRVAGQVVSVDAARNELTLKNEQTGQTFRVHVGQRTTLRRVTPEFIQTMNERAAQREARRAEGGGQSREGNGESRGGRRREGEGREGSAREGGRGDGAGREGRGGRRGEGGWRGGGGGFGGGGNGNMFDSLPAITLAELKKGDGVMVTATPGADASTVTAVSIVSGDAEFIRRMQQRGEGRQRGMSPGLPGDVIGGGTGGNREPPR